MKTITTWSQLLIITLAIPFIVLTSRVAHAGDKTVIWQTGEGYVALVPQDLGTAVKVTPNNHPADLTESQLIGLLGSIQVREDLKDKPAPLFSEGSLTLLAPHIQQALKQANPGQDVSFAVVGLYKTLLGLANRAMISSGRIFYKDGKLNLILGIVKQDIRYRTDGSDRDFRLIPIGYRQDAAQGEWSLVPSEDHPFEMPRRDWLVLDPKYAKIMTQVSPAPEAQIKTTASAPQKKSDRPLTERLATLNELKAKGLITEDEYKQKRAEIMAEQEPERTFADRLATLNELKAKGLITPEEYRAKRIQIMNDL